MPLTAGQPRGDSTAVGDRVVGVHRQREGERLFRRSRDRQRVRRTLPRRVGATGFRRRPGVTHRFGIILEQDDVRHRDGEGLGEFDQGAAQGLSGHAAPYPICRSSAATISWRDAVDALPTPGRSQWHGRRRRSQRRPWRRHRRLAASRTSLERARPRCAGGKLGADLLRQFLALRRGQAGDFQDQPIDRYVVHQRATCCNGRRSSCRSWSSRAASPR